VNGRRVTALPRLRRVVLLLVEEDPERRQVLEDALGVIGATVLTAVTTADALRVLREIVPSAIMTDSTIPDGVGVRLLDDLGNRPSASAVPVIGSDRRSLPTDPFVLYEKITRVVTAAASVAAALPSR